MVQLTSMPNMFLLVVKEQSVESALLFDFHPLISAVNCILFFFSPNLLKSLLSAST